MTLNKTSMDRLQGVHPDLVKVVLKAAEITDQPFIVTEGVRTVERERSLIAKGLSSLKSPFSCRHVPTNGFGHAVDLAPVVNGVIPWKDWSKFASVARAMKAAASQVHVSITWGGDWKTFKDGPHFELPKNLYP
ncbi:M15 family metallopeptidase [Rhodoblastus acidophilus]|uniref:M15 family metallopeptidase n=1 Tax=Rhodoblastus acidophilus TaxID=1074 RepID=UPI00222452B3|nr:M15 family metallopeptidase [Rhodoblastus acidophilus]MCW2286858.1 peptidoglycan L-alanyl-D-glutamate endopeptidase CwlK [Rhodoblastus acidophilus]